ncbi:MAG: nucleotidyltransferase domain-containing protein [Candidatus Thorarchaeota archaeon]
MKGFFHPKERIIAYLRYIPDKQGNRSSIEGVKFSKIYSLGKRKTYLEKNYPHYLWFDRIQGRILQSVPLKNIAIILNPVDTLNQLRDKGLHINDLQKSSLKLITYLKKESGIDWSDIGITGSQLANLTVSDSDIDLVVYGTKPSYQLYSTLKSGFDTASCIHRYSGKMLNRHVNFRWGKNNRKWSLLRSIEAKKNLQGLFEDKEFFIRLVKKNNERKYKYGDIIFRNAGVHSVCCEVIDDSNSIFTPCTYLVTCKTIPDLTEIVSYRGRFTEQVRNGMNVKASGRLESVHIKNTDETYKRLVLGENSSDYLIPI